MALETRLVQKLGQSLLMTPQLQQAIKLLAMGQLEFREAIEKELLENPVLEESREQEDSARERSADNDSSSPDAGQQSAEATPFTDTNEPVESSQSTDKSPVEWEDYLDRYTDAHGVSSPRGMTDMNERPSFEASLTRPETLFDHVIAQLRMSEIAEADQAIAMHILGNLDKDGYLCCSAEEIAEVCNCSLDDVQRVLEIFHSLEPAGVGASSLTECLLIQLDNLGMGTGLEAKIVQNHLEKLEKRKFDQIARSEQVEVEQVYRAVSTIQRLEPRPGRNFHEEATRYIIPDIYVEKVGGEYVITLNEDGLPKLRISPYYVSLLKSNDSAQNSNKQYLAERLKAASWLIKSIHQRQSTIYKVTESIVKFQREFFDSGISRLKPLVLKDIADDIGMHESTVSRVTTNKYVHTPQGIFELKYFFTSGIKTALGEVSSSSIKEKIRTLIASENTKDPISDQQIVEALLKENVEIARRTVAKYREGLGIPSSSRRKKHF